MKSFKSIKSTIVFLSFQSVSPSNWSVLINIAFLSPLFKSKITENKVASSQLVSNLLHLPQAHRLQIYLKTWFCPFDFLLLFYLYHFLPTYNQKYVNIASLISLSFLYLCTSSYASLAIVRASTTTKGAIYEKNNPTFNCGINCESVVMR